MLIPFAMVMVWTVGLDTVPAIMVPCWLAYGIWAGILIGKGSR